MGTQAHRLTAAHDVRRWSADVVVAMVVGLAVCLTIRGAAEPDARPPDLVSYVLGGAMGLVLLARRRRPLLVLLLASALLLVYYSAGYPGFAPAVVLAVPLYSATVAGHLRWAVAVAGGFMAAAVVVVGFRLHDPEGLVQVISLDAALLAVVILLGEVIRSRQDRLAEAEARLVAVEQQREREAERRVAEERLRIAREVHDIVGHSVATIGVHAGLAEEVLDQDPRQARESLRVVRQTARDAMTELKAALSLLRLPGPGQPLAPRHTLADLDTLIAPVDGTTLSVTTRVLGAPRPLPVVVDQSAYRVVQEAMTNTARHAGASEAEVCVRYEKTELVIEVSDNGRGVPHNDFPRGHGLTGMAERVGALGGTMRAGNGERGGFAVTARFPLELGQ